MTGKEFVELYLNNCDDNGFYYHGNSRYYIANSYDNINKEDMIYHMKHNDRKLWFVCDRIDMFDFTMNDNIDIDPEYCNIFRNYKIDQFLK